MSVWYEVALACMRRDLDAHRAMNPAHNCKWGLMEGWSYDTFLNPLTYPSRRDQHIASGFYRSIGHSSLPADVAECFVFAGHECAEESKDQS